MGLPKLARSGGDSREGAHAHQGLRWHSGVPLRLDVIRLVTRRDARPLEWHMVWSSGPPLTRATPSLMVIPG